MGRWDILISVCGLPFFHASDYLIFCRNLLLSFVLQTLWGHQTTYDMNPPPPPDLFLSSPCISSIHVVKDTLPFSKVDPFLSNKIYNNGCLKTFLQITRWNGTQHNKVYFLTSFICLIYCGLSYLMRKFNCKISKAFSSTIHFAIDNLIQIFRWYTLGITYILTWDGLRNQDGRAYCWYCPWIGSMWPILPFSNFSMHIL